MIIMMIIMMSTSQGSKWAARRSSCERPLYDDYDDYSNYDDYHDCDDYHDYDYDDHSDYDDYHGCDVKHDFDDYHDYDYDDYVTGKQVGSKEELV